MRTFLVAVVAHTHADVEKFLLASALGPEAEDGVIDCWWIAEDDRTDRSDNDSAIFVPRGAQSDMAAQIDMHMDAQTDLWSEEGYPYAETDVSGTWWPR